MEADEVRVDDPTHSGVGSAVSAVFVCYAHEDRDLKDRLFGDRALLGAGGVITVWSDERIRASQDWEQEIYRELNAARVVVCLVSPAFFQSKFIQDSEFQQALRRRESAGLQILWVPLRGGISDQIRDAGLGKIQAAWPLDDPIDGIVRRQGDLALRSVREALIERVREVFDPLEVRVREVLGDRYELKQRFSSGRTTVSYAAYDKLLRRKVAIRALKESGGFADFVARLGQTARIGQSENFLAVHDARLEKVPLCVVQYVEGKSLRNTLASGRVSTEWARRILVELLRAMARVHGKGRFHLNIRPSNILIDAGGRAYFASFSLDGKTRCNPWSDALPPDPARLDERRAYFAPEMLDRALLGEECARVDQYLLGLVGYELLTGYLPLRPTHGADPKSVADFGDLPPIRDFEHCKFCSQHFVRAIERMTAKYPDDRFDNLSDAILHLGGGAGHLIEGVSRERLEIAKDSYLALTADPERARRFFAKFYDTLLRRSKRAQRLFEASLGQDPAKWTRQLDVLQQAIQLLLSHAEYERPSVVGPNILTRVAVHHGARLGLTAADYADFQWTLIETVLDLNRDSGVTSGGLEQLKRAWNKSLEPGLKYMSETRAWTDQPELTDSDLESVPEVLRGEHRAD